MVPVMILQCPDCQARFAVPDAMIPAEGRTVKCGRCAHQWHTPGSDEAPDFAALALEVAGSDYAPATPQQLPAVAVKSKVNIPVRPFMVAVPVLALLWLILALYAYYPGWQPRLGGVYALLGATTTQGLAFADVSMQPLTNGGKTNYVIGGSISNQSAEERLVPTVRVQLKGKDGGVLWERDYEVNEMLKPGEVYPFRIDNVETAFAASVTSIVVDVGHNLQLMMR
jgi:predicted Zn finger-like uncharacterized protein